MSFDCKYKVNDDCKLRKLPCNPGAKGCVLNKTARFVEPPKPTEEKDRK